MAFSAGGAISAPKSCHYLALAHNNIVGGLLSINPLLCTNPSLQTPASYSRSSAAAAVSSATRSPDSSATSSPLTPARASGGSMRPRPPGQSNRLLPLSACFMWANHKIEAANACMTASVAECVYSRAGSADEYRVMTAGPRLKSPITVHRRVRQWGAAQKAIPALLPRSRVHTNPSPQQRHGWQRLPSRNGACADHVANGCALGGVPSLTCLLGGFGAG